MVFWKSRQAGGILLIILAARSFASLDTATKHATQLVPLLMLLWFRYAFQAVVTCLFAMCPMAWPGPALR
jgi:hypothetical protein